MPQPSKPDGWTVWHWLAILGLLISFPVKENPVTSAIAKLTTPKPKPSEISDWNKITQSAQFKKPLSKGEPFLSYEVTSPWGPRNCSGCSSYHQGVDVGTPIGTPIKTIGKPKSKTYVECTADNSGTYSIQTSPDFPGMSFESLHLSKCVPGEYWAGEILGFSGAFNSGPHLHFQVRDSNQSGNGFNGKVNPPRGFVYWVLQGKSPKSGEV